MQLQNKSYLRKKKRQRGFTLIEVLIVVVMIGVLSAIAAPGWLGFLGQQRVNRANDVVLRALQRAQSEARTRKLNYSFVIRMASNGIPELAYFPDTDGTATPTNWQSLGADLGLSANQVWAGTNFTGINTGGSTPTAVTTTPVGRIQFDHTGVLRSSSKALEKPLTITLGQFGSNPPSTGSMRCVQITTLLGSMETRREDKCANVDP